MKHYFTDNNNLKTNKKEITILFNEKEYQFITDVGVFSKNNLDFGSEVLIKEFLKDNQKKQFKFLDLGCGYGPISVLISSYFFNCEYVLSDVNTRALDLAKENLIKHDVKKYRLIKSDSFENIDEKFDVIMSNPPIRAGKQVIFNIYENAFNHLNENGSFYCVIQTKHGAKSTEKKLKEVFGNCEQLAIYSGYRIYKCIK